MRRALGRAYQRVQGNHPRRPASPSAKIMTLVCDAMLAAAAIAFVAGVGLVAWSVFAGPEPVRIVVGLALVAIGPMLLLAWERLAWEPFIKRFSQL